MTRHTLTILCVGYLALGLFFQTEKKDQPTPSVQKETQQTAEDTNPPRKNHFKLIKQGER